MTDVIKKDADIEGVSGLYGEIWSTLEQKMNFK
jgi:hypothetical protein